MICLCLLNRLADTSGVYCDDDQQEQRCLLEAEPVPSSPDAALGALTYQATTSDSKGYGQDQVDDVPDVPCRSIA